jgi:hypothetical protein
VSWSFSSDNFGYCVVVFIEEWKTLWSETVDLSRMKKIGFLSFGHWTSPPQSQTRSAADALLQSIDIAVEAERLGMDGAYFRVNHFAQQLASPFSLLAAVGAKTRKIGRGYLQQWHGRTGAISGKTLTRRRRRRDYDSGKSSRERSLSERAPGGADPDRQSIGSDHYSKQCNQNLRHCESVFQWLGDWCARW